MIYIKFLISAVESLYDYSPPGAKRKIATPLELLVVSNQTVTVADRFLARNNGMKVKILDK